MKTNLLVVLLVLMACGPDSSAVVDRPGDDTVELSEDELSWAGSDPELWRQIWYSKYAHKLTAPNEPKVARPALPTIPTVLLIPGTTIGPEFFGPMQARLSRDGIDAVIWAPSDLFTESLATGAARIKAKVESLLAERGKTRLTIVAQCDAGVAARYYAQVLGGHARLDRLITFVSAHHGSRLAPAGSSFTGWQALKDIKPNSPFFQQLEAAPVPAGLAFTSIYSCADEYLWPQSTSVVPGATNVRYCNRYVSHFSPFWDLAVYDRILLTVRGEAAGLPTSY